jgi:hypothetical protein
LIAVVRRVRLASYQETLRGSGRAFCHGFHFSESTLIH